MERELDNQFMLKEDHYFSEKRQLENQLAQVMEEKRFFFTIFRAALSKCNDRYLIMMLSQIDKSYIGY